MPILRLMGGFELGNLTGQRGLPIEVRHDKAPHPFVGMRGPKQLTDKGAADGANFKRLQVANVYSETNLVVSTDSGGDSSPTNSRYSPSQPRT